jgi:hypothetical protein
VDVACTFSEFHVFWVVTTCSVVNVYRHFGETCCLLFRQSSVRR